MLSVCADVGEAFRVPHPPLTELFVDVGVARNGAWVASAGFDFAGYWANLRVTVIAEEYRLDRDEALAVAALSTLHEKARPTLIDAVLDIQEAGRARTPQAMAVAEIDRAFDDSPATTTATTTAAPTVASTVPLHRPPGCRERLSRGGHRPRRQRCRGPEADC